MLPIYIKTLYHSPPHFPFLNLNRIRALRLTIHQGLIVKLMQTQQSRQIQEKRIKIMVANSGMKHETKTMLEVIRGLVLDFVLYFVTV